MISAEVRCPAKVNVILSVLAREASGYHQIESLFQAIDFSDRLTVERSGSGIALDVVHEGPFAAGGRIGALGDPRHNTVMRAAREFFSATGIQEDANMRLRKVIPAGTGLGGGSSDAAGALLALNALYGAPLGSDELVALGGRIGADVPFFCSRAATAFASGRGDRVTTSPPPPSRPVVVVVPEARVKTANAYAELSSVLDLPAPSAVRHHSDFSDWGRLADMQTNDFERIVFDQVPGLSALRSLLEDRGAGIARLSGSGSALFAVFPNGATADRAAAEARRQPGVAGVVLCATLDAEPANPMTGMG